MLAVNCKVSQIGNDENDNDDYKIGQKLKKYRLAAKLTRAELAEFADVSENTIYRAEKGETSMNFANIRSICRVLRITPNDLMPDEDIEEMCVETPEDYKRLTSDEKEVFWKNSKFVLRGILASR